MIRGIVVHRGTLEEFERLRAERDELAATVEMFRQTGNRVINYKEDPQQWVELTINYTGAEAIAKHDLKVKLEAIRELREYNVKQKRKLGSAWGGGHVIDSLQQEELRLEEALFLYPQCEQT